MSDIARLDAIKAAAFAAARAGLKSTDNPYRRETDHTKHDQWRSAFYQAQTVMESERLVEAAN